MRPRALDAARVGGRANCEPSNAPRRVRDLRRCAITAALVFVAVTAIGLPLALAQSPDTPVSIGGISPMAAVQAATYWTDERMRDAKPMPLPELPANQQMGLLSGTPAPGGLPLMASSGAPGDAPQEVAGDEVERLLEGPSPLFGTSPFSYTRYRLFPDLGSTYKAFPYRATGKLFFTIPGQGNYVCSAASVSSANLAVVWTAGHCVYSPGTGFHTNFSFAPARRLTNNPFGLWRPLDVDGVWTLAGWQNGLFNYDHGALVMKKNSGIKIGTKVGFLGFVANVSRQQHWHLHGYPQGPRNLAQTPPGAQFDGVHHEICAAAWATDDQPGNADDPPTMGVGCDHTGGTSGGPWVINLSSMVGATNLLNGNNSYRYTSPNPPENLKLFSPYFTDGAINLRNAAQAVPVP